MIQNKVYKYSKTPRKLSKNSCLHMSVMAPIITCHTTKTANTVLIYSIISSYHSYYLLLSLLSVLITYITYLTPLMLKMSKNSCLPTSVVAPIIAHCPTKTANTVLMYSIISSYYSYYLLLSLLSVIITPLMLKTNRNM